MATPVKYDPRLAWASGSIGSTSMLSLGLAGSARVLEAALGTDALIDSGESWVNFDARRFRYRLYWGLYEQNLFAKLLDIADEVREKYDLDASIRSLYAPAHRIGEFWATHLYTGSVDKEAGDGKADGRASALPIDTENDALRAALSVLWRDSRVEQELEIWGRYGAVLGDAPVKVADDPWRRRVYLQAIHPGTIRDYYTDPAGNCRGYVIQRQVPDPEWNDWQHPAPPVTFTEVCYRRGDAVIFETYREGDEYDWRVYEPGQPRVGWRWSMGYGFVPLVIAQHRNLGFAWGASEYHFSTAKLIELDRLASKLCDQVYRTVRAPWWFEDGAVEDTDIEARTPGDDRTDDTPILAGPGKPHSLVAPLSLGDTLRIAIELREQIEAEHPELIADAVGANASGEARKVAREKAEANVIRRRGGYDAAWVAAQKMAISVGALGKYPGYERFDENSYARGDLDHCIDERPVFAMDEGTRLKDEEQRGKTLKVFLDCGLPLELSMKRAGFCGEEIDEAEAEAAAQATAAVDRLRQLRMTDGGAGQPADAASSDAVNADALGSGGDMSPEDTSGSMESQGSNSSEGGPP